MSYELCYTSAPSGLAPGAKGFCTVGLTRGTPAALVERLESLSGYRPLFPASSPQAALNPVAWAHWRVTAGAQTYSVLSRVCFAGLDYTQRSNKFAHHVALTATELPIGGPAWALAQSGLMRAAWTGAPVEYDRGPQMPSGDAPPAKCARWAAACGDAGWAAALAESCLGSPTRPAFLIYPPALDVLGLLCEALALVPPRQRWQVTFNTYFTGLSAGSTCAWRCCAAGSPTADEARRAGGALVIDLTAPQLPAPDSPLAQIARGNPGSSQAVDASSHSLIDSDDLADDFEPIPLSRRQFPATATRQTPSSAMALAPAGRHSAGMAPPDESTNQDWMPPTGATVVEPAHSGFGRFQPRSRRAGLWLTAAASALLGAGVTYAALRSRASDEARAAIEQGTARLAALEHQSGVDRDALTSTRRELDDFRHSQERAIELAREEGKQVGMQNPDPKIWQRVGDATPEDEIKRQIENARALQRQEDKVLIDQARAAAKIAPAIGTTEGAEALQLKSIELVQFSRRADVPPLMFLIAEAPKSSPTELPLGKLPTESHNLKVELVQASGGESKYRIEHSPTGELVYREKAGLGAEKVELCRIALADALRLHWPQMIDDADDAARRVFLQTCILRLTDDAGARGSIQFIRPTVRTLALADSPNVAVPEAAGTAIRFSVAPDIEAPKSTWTQRDSDGDSAYFADGAGQVVSIKLQNGALECNYQKLHLNQATDLATKENELAELAKNVPQKQGGGYDWEKLSGKGVNEKERYNKKQSQVARARQALESLDAFPNGVAILQLSNGVVVCRVNLLTRVVK